MVRTLADPAQVVASLRDALRLIEPDLPLFRIETMDQMLARQRWQYEVFGSMFAVFAAIALVLSSVGLSAVTSYSVTQRTQAIGAFGVGKILQSLLAQTAAGDPLTLVLVIGVLVAVAVLACLWQARRAARLDPMRALRYE
jgi:putative ABC transport system permease protein